MPALHITGISLSTSMMKFKSDAAFWNVPHGHQEIFWQDFSCIDARIYLVMIFFLYIFRIKWIWCFNPKSLGNAGFY